jgi:Protein of unknown function (DUF1524)
MYGLHTKPGTHGCVVAKGELLDPYDVRQQISFIRGRPGVEVDHVVALKNAWKTGASGWPARKRERFANDPLKLLATSSENKREKGDSDISEWKPPLDDCAYAVRQVSIKTKYGLQVSRREKEALITTLQQADCQNDEPRLMKSSDKDIRIPAPNRSASPSPSRSQCHDRRRRRARLRTAHLRQPQLLGRERVCQRCTPARSAPRLALAGSPARARRWFARRLQPAAGPAGAHPDALVILSPVSRPQAAGRHVKGGAQRNP